MKINLLTKTNGGGVIRTNTLHTIQEKGGKLSSQKHSLEL